MSGEHPRVFGEGERDETDEPVDRGTEMHDPVLSRADGASPDWAGPHGTEADAAEAEADAAEADAAEAEAREAVSDETEPDGPGDLVLETVTAERDEYLEALRRLQADFDNFRKRVQRQQAELTERATVSLLERLLPVLDAFDLAVAHVSRPEAPIDERSGGQAQPDGPAKPGSPGGRGGRGASTSPGRAPSARGAELDEEVRPFLQIAALLGDLLAKEGLERIAEPGVEFDPTVHDAVSHEPGEPGEPGGVVVDVMRSGYRLKERVLRPAMVKVRG